MAEAPLIVPPVVPPGEPTLVPPLAPPAPTHFLDGLPDALRQDPSLSSFKDVSGLAKSYVEVNKLVGGSIRVPGADAKPEEWNAVWTKLGRPATPEEYTITRPHLSEAIPWDEGMEKDFYTAAHSAGLTPPQVQKLTDWYGRQMNLHFAAGSEGIAESIDKLQAEYGGAFDRNIALAQRVVQEYGGDELAGVLKDTGLGNHPGVVRAFVKLGHALAEEGVMAGHVEGLPGPSEALRTAREIMADRKGPYWDTRHPNHEDTIQRVKELYEVAFPNV